MPMDGLEAVADVGEGTSDNDGHGVVEITAAHLLFNIDGEHKGGTAALDGTGRIAVGVVGGREGKFGVLIVCHEFVSLLYRCLSGVVARGRECESAPPGWWNNILRKT